MKFNNGYWLMQPGIVASYAEEPAEILESEEGLTVLAATKHREHRGDTLNSPLLTITYTSPRKDIIGVRIVHHKGSRPSTAKFSLHKEQNTPKILHTEEHVSFKSGSTQVAIKKSGPWQTVFSRDGKEFTNSGWRNCAYIQTKAAEETPIGRETEQNRQSWMVEQLHISPDEKIYGFGERFTPVVKNGQSIEIWNEDPGTATEQAYKNIPFYLSSRGYGVFINSPGRISIEAGSEKVSRVSFAVEGEILEYFIISGESIKDVLQNYTALTGRPPLPPAWTFGLWLSTSFLTDYDEKTVNSFLDGMKKRNIPLSVFHFDCFWMKQYRWVDFHWDPETFPDPRGMLKRIKERGLKVCVWINPYIAQQSELFDTAAEKGYLLKKKNGDIWQTDQWQAGLGIVDFTNPDAASWYSSHLEALLEMGVDCFKTDFGERIPVNVRYYNGADPYVMHNYYTFLYNQTVFETIKKKRGEKEAVVFARSATAGSQQFPVHWGGDCLANYDSMAESLRGGLSLCMSGFAFWSHDIGGFEHTATPDLYKRWTAFGLLSTHSRLHGSSSYRVPWNFDDESVEVLQHFTALKLKLMPYVYKYAAEAQARGIPLMRHALLEFPNDPGVWHLELQYLLGPDILVAPVFSESGEVRWYLPEGTWTHLLSGERYEGPGWYEDTFNYYSLPLFARNGSIIPMGRTGTTPDYDYRSEIDIHFFEPEGEKSFICIDSDGKEEGGIEYSIKGSILSIRWEKLESFRMIIHQERKFTAVGTQKVRCSYEPGISIISPDTDNDRGEIELKVEQ